jgi:hypothetical protein
MKVSMHVQSDAIDFKHANGHDRRYQLLLAIFSPSVIIIGFVLASFPTTFALYARS